MSVRFSKNHFRRSGFTVAEVLIAMAVFALLAVGLYAGGFWSRAIAMENGRRVVAGIFADGVVKQILAVTEGELSAMATGLDPTAGISLNNFKADGSFVTETFELVINDWTEVPVQMVTDSDNVGQGGLGASFTGDALVMRLRPSIDQSFINGVDATGGFFYQVTLDYQFASAIPRRGTPGTNWSPTTPTRIVTVRTYVNN